MRRRTLALASLVTLAGLLAAAGGCGDSTTRPPGEKQVVVRTDSFFEKDIEVTAGKSVRWVNGLRRSDENLRTVTSGTGPDDPEAGTLFDATLRGFASGEAEGEDFVFRFTAPGVYPYFSRYPVGHEFSGTVTVW